MMNDNQNKPTALLFEDKLGLGRYGGMAVAVTAVSQVAEQFVGAGLYVALAFSFLIAVYYSRRAIRLPLLDCLIWVPIYGCTLFITSLGSNNVVGTTQEKSQFQKVRVAYESEMADYQEEIKTLKMRLQAYQAALEKSQQAREIYRQLLKAKAPGVEISSTTTRRGAYNTKPNGLFATFVKFLAPAEANAQPPVLPADDAPSEPTPRMEDVETQRLLQQLQAIENEEKQLLESIQQAPAELQMRKKPESLQAPKEVEPKIWKKW